ncbi:zinc finger protein 862-like [Mytilus edulis]|uniref:zinc finger protein 862-like n=1 Tax=Mytilus edulis TaxID=6550 RepID=UPI0039F0F502
MSLQSWLKSPAPLKRKAATSDLENTPPQKKFCKTMSQNSYDWYVKDTFNMWHCVLCRDAKFSNKYSIGHDKPQKTTNHSRHAKSGDHLMAITRQKNTSINTDTGIKDIVVKQMSKDDKVVKLYLKAAYHLAKQEQSKAQFKPLLELLNTTQEVPLDTVAYTSHQSITEFQSVLSSIVKKNKIFDINNSAGFSISIDESTDLANKKRLITFVEYIHNHVKETCFLSNIQISSGTANAEMITNLVLTDLKSNGLDINKLYGISTDGASVMTGKKTGVVVRLREHVPTLIGVHCAAHKCSLATSQAARSITELQSYSRTVSNIFHYFSNSALRSNKLRQIQSLLNLPELKYAEVHSVRWLSLDRAVQVIFRTFPALVVALSHEAASNPTAKGLHNEVTQYRFIMFTHLLLDILPFLTRMSKVFQTESADFSKVQPIVQCTIDALKDMKESAGMYVEALDEFVECVDDRVLYKRKVSESSKKVVDQNVKLNVEGFEGFESDSESETDSEEQVSEVELRYYTQQKGMVKRVLSEYVDGIVGNLEDRFSESDMLSKFSLFVPACIVKAEREGSQTLFKFGMDELTFILDKFEERLGIERVECVSEYRQYKRLVIGNFSNSNLSSCVKSVFRNYHEILPNLVKLLELAILIPISSVPCERGFSTQNRILSRLRTSMSNMVLKDLMMISENGPHIYNFDFDEALNEWKGMKARKVYRQ